MRWMIEGGSWMCLALACHVNAAPAAETFKQLRAKELRSVVVGHVITDGAHWSDRFDADGTLVSVDLGQRKLGRWKASADEICATRPRSGEECFEVWKSRDTVEYRRDGVTFATGTLRDR